MFGEIAFGDGFVRYGQEAMGRTSHFDAIDQLVADPPGCWFTLTGEWLPSIVRDAGGPALGVYVLPPLTDGGAAPLVGGVVMAEVVRDRPEVREFVRWLLDPRWGETWSADPRASFLSAHVRFDATRCGAGDAGDPQHDVRQALCEIQRAGLAAGQWRLDGSDHMPPVIGGVTDAGRGAFLQGMLDYVSAGPGSLDGVLGAIDDAWP